MEKLFTIGKLSKMTGVSTRSIRHYDDLGLLPCASISDSNYRLFGEHELKKLQQILLLRSLGFSLSEVQKVLTVDENVQITDIFESRLKALDQEVTKLNKSKEMLEAVTRIYKTNGIDYINNFHLMKEMVSMNTKFIRIFNRLDLNIQVKILKELYETGTLQPETIRTIGENNGHLLLEELHMVLVKSLLNGIDFETEKNIMMALKKEDPEFANVAMRAMFTFDDFAKLPNETLQKWAKNCDDDELVIALKDSNNYLINKILNNMQSERADKIKEAIENNEMVSLDQSFKAMSHLIDVLRQMEMRGEIVIERFEY